MGKPKKSYVSPTHTFPYKISRRLNVMSVPRKYVGSDEEMPIYTKSGVRQSALKGQLSEGINDVAWPGMRRLLSIKREFRNRFTPERIAQIERMIQAASMSSYSKLAKQKVGTSVSEDSGKRKAWSESEWKKHMGHISKIAKPKKDHSAPPVNRGLLKPLAELLPRIKVISTRPDFKVWRRLSQESWYRNPIKVQPGALKYVISERVKKLATPKLIQHPE